MTVPETHYARSGDVNIAYQVIGDRPLDLVFVMGWVSAPRLFLGRAVFARFLRSARVVLAAHPVRQARTGLSDRVTELPTLEQRMDDVRAVMDAVGSRQAALLGVSEGGPMCTLFAATYPEKTRALVTIGTYARRLRAPDYPWGPTSSSARTSTRDPALWGGPVGIEIAHRAGCTTRCSATGGAPTCAWAPAPAPRSR